MGERGRERAPGRSRRRLLTGLLGWLLVGLASSLLALGASLPAGSHAALEASTPAAGDTVAVTADRLVLVFGDDLAAGSGLLAVSGPRGGAVTGDLDVHGDTAEVGLALAATGTHLVRYRFLSVDGHAIEGGFAFHVTDPGAVGARNVASGGDAVREVATIAASDRVRARAVPWPWVLGALAVLALAVVVRVRASAAA